MAFTYSNPYESSKVKFGNYNYNKGIFFDEKKKRIVDFDDMDLVTYQEYNRPFCFVSLV